MLNPNLNPCVPKPNLNPHPTLNLFLIAIKPSPLNPHKITLHYSTLSQGTYTPSHRCLGTQFPTCAKKKGLQGLRVAKKEDYHIHVLSLQNLSDSGLAVDRTRDL